MASPHNASSHAPKSVEGIVKEAQNFDHKSEYPLRIALRTAQNILSQAANYERDGDVQEAYLFLYRHAEFCMTKVAAHPDRKQPEYKQALARVRREVNEDLTKLENLKPEVTRRYDRYQESLRRREAARAKVLEQSAQRDISPPDLYSPSRFLNAGEHSDLALRLAHKELQRRGIPSQRRGPRDGNGAEVDDLSAGVRSLGRQLDQVHQPSGKTQLLADDRYHYPSVPLKEQIQDSGVRTTQSRQPPVPSLPPKDALPRHFATVSPPPLLSKLQQGTTGLPPSVPPKALQTADGLGDHHSSSYSFKPSAFSENGAPLRTLFLPTELRSRFLSVAQPNTRKNLETCGILCGSLVSNALFISQLVIPDQTSTSDTCDTTEEGDNALFDYVDGQELMVCGWIHTHPTQTCFLSSRDLHTSVGYQVMLPESVAIVCAPSQDPDHGIFRLTDPPGKQAILDCHQTGLFHPHNQTNIYTDALRPGHVSELQGLQFQVVDLRKGR